MLLHYQIRWVLYQKTMICTKFILSKPKNSNLVCSVSKICVLYQRCMICTKFGVVCIKNVLSVPNWCVLYQKCVFCIKNVCSVSKMYYLYQIWCVLYQKCIICTKFGIPNKNPPPPFPLRHLSLISPLITALMIVYLFNMSCTRYAEVVSDKHALYQKARTCSCTVPKASALVSKVGALYQKFGDIWYSCKFLMQSTTKSV